MNKIKINKKLFLYTLKYINKSSGVICEIKENSLGFTINKCSFILYHDDSEKDIIWVSTLSNKKIVLNWSKNWTSSSFAELEKIKFENKLNKNIIFYGINEKKIDSANISIEEFIHRKKISEDFNLNIKILKNFFKFFNKTPFLSTESVLEWSNQHISLTNNIRWIYLFDKNSESKNANVIFFKNVHIILPILEKLKNKDLKFSIIENKFYLITDHYVVKTNYKILKTPLINKIIIKNNSFTKYTIFSKHFINTMDKIMMKQKNILPLIKYKTQFCLNKQYLSINFYNTNYNLERILTPILKLTHQVEETKKWYFDIKYFSSIFTKTTYDQQELKLYIKNKSLFIEWENKDWEYLFCIKGLNKI